MRKAWNKDFSIWNFLFLIPSAEFSERNNDFFQILFIKERTETLWSINLHHESLSSYFGLVMRIFAIKTNGYFLRRRYFARIKYERRYILQTEILNENQKHTSIHDSHTQISSSCICPCKSRCIAAHNWSLLLCCRLYYWYFSLWKLKS